MVYLDGVFQSNVTKGTQAFTASSLTAGTQHTIGTRTVGATGLVNNTWVNSTARTNPGIPSISLINPAKASPGGAGFMLTVEGSGFNSGSIVKWNGADRATAFVSTTRLTASIPASDLSPAGTASITVFNPPPGGGTSNTRIFRITTGDTTISTIGVFRNGIWYLRNSNTGGFADLAFTFGVMGDKPVTGDWTGIVKHNPGVFRNGVWYLRNSNTGGPGEQSFIFGQAGDVPVTGDWTGTGIDTPGVFRNGVWYLRNSNTGGPADLTFIFGQSGDIPVVGDWTGAGKDTIGVFRNGVWYLRNSNANGNPDSIVLFGSAGDYPVTGDWTGTGRDTVGVFRAGTFFLRNSNTNGFADIMFNYGQSGDIPKTGNW
jgi:hypothetical protein